jgi:hypothetical protein
VLRTENQILTYIIFSITIYLLGKLLIGPKVML